MDIRLFQLKVTPGQPTDNLNKILQAIEQAKCDRIDLIIFPEMAIPGYLLGDEWERLSFLRDCQYCGEEIRKASDKICVIFGNVAIDWNKKNEDGRVRKYNALFAAENGEFIVNTATRQDYFIKMLMPNYREFDDNRHFFDPRKLAYELKINIDDIVQPVNSKLGKLGCILCEDGWDQDYNISPLKILSNKQALIFINISSSPYTFNKNSKRNRVFSNHALSHKTPMLYINNTGLQDNGKTIFTFDGVSRAYSVSGNVIGEITPYQEQSLDTSLQELCQPHDGKVINLNKDDTIANQFSAIQYGIREFMGRIGLKKVVIGTSGGIDSALVASIFRTILAPEDILLVSMPGPFTSNTTKTLAKQLANNLGCFIAEIPIEHSVKTTCEQISSTPFTKENGSLNLSISDFVFENIQARDRSSRILAAVAAAFGGAFTCNANKSEMTIGYSTLYGDLGGFIAPIADLWKGEVYAMAEYMNKEIYKKEVIPQGTIDIVPSAELSNKQNVEAGKGDPLYYPYHDTLFKSWVEHWDRATPEDNLSWFLNGTLNEKLGYKGDLKELFSSQEEFTNDLERWWCLYQGMAVAKRIQAPPVLAVKRRAFGFDHRESQLGPRFSQKYLQMKKEIKA